MSGQNEKEKKKSGKWKRGLLIALCVILVLILVIGAVATILVNRLMNQMNRVDPNKESALHPSVVDQILATDPDLETVDPDSDVSLPNISDITFPTIPEETESPDTTDPTGAPPVETVPVVRGDHLINIMLIGQDKRPGQGRQPDAPDSAWRWVQARRPGQGAGSSSWASCCLLPVPGYSWLPDAAFLSGGRPG